MYSFGGGGDLFYKQLSWITISIIVFFSLSFVDFRFLRKTTPVMIVFVTALILLGAVIFFGKTVKGSKSWLDLGFFLFQPADFAKCALIIVLAKYFSKRHIEIANIKHIVVSGIYACLLGGLILLQPDLGSAIILFSIWFGMIVVSGISKRHLFTVIAIGAIIFGFLWIYSFKDYQKKRIMTFIHPLSDVRGAGYNAYQSTIAVGSGMIFGKGIGYGTQSRLNFLPEYQTDFIFAAFAEEWGLIGVVLLLSFYLSMFWRVLDNAMKGETNFEILFAVGIAIMFGGHFLINVGMNMGIMPVTGIPLPFVSYGGSHILISFSMLGILMGMRRYGRDAHKDQIKNEFLGI